MITVKNKRTYKGGGIYIGRPTLLGNPFIIGKDGSREEVIAKYKIWLTEQYASNPAMKKTIDKIVVMNTCQDVTFICWCAPEACHGDELKAFIEALQ